MPKIEANTVFKIFGVFYVGIVIIMSSVALISFITRPQIHSFIYLVGALLFTSSDLIMILKTFGKDDYQDLKINDLLLYYLGQLSIAVSLLFI